jgi:rRNA maturation endonuclease Nob1
MTPIARDGRRAGEMTGLTPQFALLAVLTTGVGVIMSRLGVRRGLLHLRRESRRCASCSKLINGYTCPDCGRRFLRTDEHRGERR